MAKFKREATRYFPGVRIDGVKEREGCAVIDPRDEEIVGDSGIRD